MSKFWLEKYEGGHKQSYPWDVIVSFVLRSAAKVSDRKDLHLLEVGCGSCSNILFAAGEGLSTYGIDISKHAIEQGQNWLEEKGLTADLRVGSYTVLPFGNDSFDLVIDRAGLTCSNYPQIVQAVSEIHRCMKIGGRFLFNCYSELHSSARSGEYLGNGTVKQPTEGSLAGYDQITFLSVNQITELFAADWEIESLNRLEKTDLNTGLIHAEYILIARRFS